MIFLSIAVGLQVGAHWPGVDPARVGPFIAASYLRPYLFTLLPNMLWLGGVFFVIAGLTRAMAPVYVAGVLALIGYLLATNLVGDLENKTLAAFIDPIGTVAVSRLNGSANKISYTIKPLEGAATKVLVLTEVGGL
ncbi:hypothetical protein B4Q13_21080, partial [Lacticaseibacillus rhamnosus]